MNRHYMLSFFLIIAASLNMYAQDKPAYRIFNGENAKDVPYKKMLKEAAKADIIFFGELHNNPIAHWLQLVLTKDLQEKSKKNIVLGAEMYESDNQQLIDEYFAGHINTKSFEKEARLWNNYETDYKPVLEMAKEKGIPMIATNIPRRYANLVYRKGLDSLSSLGATAEKYIAPLPIPYDPELPAYKSMLEMMGGHGGDNLPKAQAIKDATMAHFILKNWKKGKLFVHFNGAYHSDDFQGIIWYINHYHPGLKTFSISSVEQAQLDTLEEENQNKAHYIIVIDELMTKTY
ncbi:MAG: ChaN family lipoprotein [Chitinophagales bacterium]|nr:ChaN family lipoprotein [Chitinophagales bacterium]